VREGILIQTIIGGVTGGFARYLRNSLSTSRATHQIDAIAKLCRQLRRDRSESQLSAWEFEFSLLHFHNLQNCSAEINAQATHTVHAVPDLHIAAGRFGGRFSHQIFDQREIVFGDRQEGLTASATLASQPCKFGD
jgi:hypothetical protein